MYSEKDRLIFEYSPDGKATVKADPLALRRKVALAAVKLSGKTIHDLVEATRPPDPGPDGAVDVSLVPAAELADERLAEVVREAFGMPAYDPQTGEGATEAMTSALWRRWCEFMEKNA
jgi:hypothetical protein